MAIPVLVLSEMVSVIFAVLVVSFWAITAVIKLSWKFLTLIVYNSSSVSFKIHDSYITRSHGSVTSVVRATREVNGRRQTYPSHHTHTPTVTKYCTRDYVHHIFPQATFGQDHTRGYVSPYSQNYHSIFLFLSLYAKSFHGPIEPRPLNRFCHAIHQQTRIHAG